MRFGNDFRGWGRGLLAQYYELDIVLKRVGNMRHSGIQILTPQIEIGITGSPSAELSDSQLLGCIIFEY